MDGVANWDLLLVFGVFTAVICALGWYVNTHRAPEPSPQNQAATTRYAVECERKPDGCFWAVVPALPGVLVHGGNEDEVKARVSALALRILAERLDSRETKAHTFLFQVDSESHSGVDPLRWTVFGLILKPSGMLRLHGVGHARGH